MSKSVYLFVISLLAIFSFVWLSEQSFDSQAEKNAKISHYLLKNKGKVPMAATEPSDWFMKQRNFPDNSQVSKQYYKAINKVKEDKAKYPKDPNAVIWEMRGPTNVHGRVSDISADPNNPDLVYTATATGGVFKSTDGGASWNCMTDDIGMTSSGAVAVAPSNPEIVYIGGGEANIRNYSYEGNGVYRSDDGGLTWTDIGLNESGRIAKIIVDPEHPDTVFVAVLGSYYSLTRTEYGVYRSYNGGDTWDRVLYDEGCIDLGYHPSGVLIAALWKIPYGQASGVYRSTDMGDNWSRLGAAEGLPLPQIQANRIGIAMDPVTGTTYAQYTASDGSFNEMFKSTDMGATWTDLNAGALSDLNASHLYGWYFGRVFVAPGNPDYVFPTGFDVWKSTDGGASYQNISYTDVYDVGGYWYGGIHVDQHAMWISPNDSDILYSGGDGGIYFTEDGGYTWIKQTGLPITQFYAIAMDPKNPDRIYGGTQDNGTAMCFTGNADEFEHRIGGDGFFVVVDPYDSDIIYGEWQYGNILKSTDGGQTFYYASIGLDRNEKFNWRTPIVVNPQNSNIVYTGAQRVYKSNDYAGIWNPVSGYITNLSITAIAVAPSNPNVIYVGCEGGLVWIDFNGGSDWTNISDGLPSRWVTSIAVDFDDPAIAYITHSGYRPVGMDLYPDPPPNAGDLFPYVSRTTDYGETWTSITGDLPMVPVNDIVVDPLVPGHLIIGNDVGVYETFDLGTTWTPVGNNLPPAVVMDIELHPSNRTLLIGTYGRSMFSTVLPCGDETDSDGDGIADLCDNCPDTYNPLQLDIDYDLIGDLCDECTDSDGDGYGEPGYAIQTCEIDNCPTVYNPGQTDFDSNGLGDLCDFRDLIWDTIATKNSSLTVGSNGNYGHQGIGGANLDFTASSECDPAANIYLFDGSPVVAYEPGGELELSHSTYGNAGYILMKGPEENIPTESNARYDQYQVGTITTKDLQVAVDVTWWSPKQTSNAEFVVQRMSVYAFDGGALNGLTIGNVVDFDIPSADYQNTGSFYEAGNMIYFRGSGTGCNPDYNRYGGISLLGMYLNSDTASFDGTSAYSGHVRQTSEIMGNFDPLGLYSKMSNAGYSLTGSMEDLYGILTAVHDYDLAAGDTLHIYYTIASVFNGTSNDIKNIVPTARQWVHDYLGDNLNGCCGLYTGGLTGNINCDEAGLRDLADITKLIDNVYISKTALCCDENGNTNGDIGNLINLADITRLIDHVYISKNATVACQ